MENESKVYEKPAITDFGSLERLTAACSSTGLGDFSHKNDTGFTTNFTDSHGQCVSSP